MQIALSLLLCVIVVQANKGPEPCTTHDGKQGTCVFNDHCPTILNEIANSAELKGESLNKFKCKDREDIVCCTSPTVSATYGKELSDRRFCGLQHSDDYNSDVNSTSIDEFPWLAALLAERTGKERIYCHGTLINERYVLSVAQCFTGKAADAFNITKVKLGEYHKETENDCVDLPQFDITECNKAEVFHIEKIILHPFHHQTSFIIENNDIALIRLDRRVTYTDYIRPICLPVQGTVFAIPGESLYTSGWGRIRQGGTDAEIKKKIQTTLITNEECVKRYHSAYDISGVNHLCTLDTGSNLEYSCQGDSGAPIMSKHRNQWHIEGMVSQGAICGQVYPGVQTKIVSFLEWIKQNIRQ